MKKALVSRPKAVLLNVGDELLKGSVLNTNARFLGRELTGMGFEVTRQISCQDSLQSIKEALRAELPDSDLMILSGGLGPTPDDVTRDAIAEFFRMPLELSLRQWDFIRAHYRSRRKKVPAIVKKEAMFPRGSVPLFNRYGIALGFYIQAAGRLVAVLPGVPYELENMFSKLLVPVLRKKFKGFPKRYPVIVRTAGISEPEVMKKLGKDFFDDPFEFGIYPAPGEVALRLYASEPSVAARLKKKIKTRLAGDLYAWEEKGLSEVLGEMLMRNKKSIAVAESCTGGLCAAEITRVPGASRYFRGSVSVYQRQTKKQIGLKDSDLKDGEVSARTAKALALAIRRHMGADYGIGITGIAGPSGGSAKKPVGLVYIAAAGPRKSYVQEHHFWGERSQVQIKAVKKALEHVYRLIKKGG